jgi:sialate O-acetylesterase
MNKINTESAPVMKKILLNLLTTALLFWAAPHASAELTLASPFTDHMVLQREMKVPIWGSADPGTAVTVTFAGQTKTAVTDANGKWKVTLDPMVASSASREMMVSSNLKSEIGNLTFSDVLVGEVWLGSGQSNMDATMSKKVKWFAGVNNEEAEIAAADYPLIRMFTGEAIRTNQPQSRIPGEWKVCTPQNAPAFSAVGYFFARQLQKDIQVPVGIITLAYGASSAHAWISRETLVADPKLKPIVAQFDKEVSAFRANPPDAVGAAPSEDVSAKARKAEKAVPDPVTVQQNPTVLFNGMIAPVIPYAIRGVIWYQGETMPLNAGETKLYPHIQAVLIREWRALWGQGDFPFYIVQIAAHEKQSPEKREAQATVLAIPNTAMAVAIDIGDPKNVHPPNKQDVGDRLARIALAKLYGKKIEYSGPMYSSMKIEGPAVRISFSHTAEGLVAKGGPLKPFVIAGADGKFVSAEATIDGDSVLVSSAEVPAPVAVRYAWANYPEGCNLYNTAGLPCAPFRTDAQPGAL